MMLFSGLFFILNQKKKPKQNPNPKLLLQYIHVPQLDGIHFYIRSTG